jgi:hypothetical protein
VLCRKLIRCYALRASLKPSLDPDQTISFFCSGGSGTSFDEHIDLKLLENSTNSIHRRGSVHHLLLSGQLAAMLHLMSRSKHSNVSYTPIDTAESDSLLFDSESDRKAIPLATSGLTRNSGFYFFLVSCTIALVISAFNSAFLSATNSYQIFATSKPSRAPSVYMGLEKLPPNKSVCRSRMTFPKQFATFRDDNLNDMTPVHAPGDKMSLSFGGEVRPFFSMSYDTLKYRGFL